MTTTTATSTNTNPQKLLLIENSSGSPLGSTLQWLHDKNITYDLVKAAEFFKTTPSNATDNKPYPISDSYSGFIIGGGGMNVDEESKYPWLANEKKFIRQNIASNKKILGLCLGGQLIAEVMGAPVGKNSQWETGFYPLELSYPTSVIPKAENIPLLNSQSTNSNTTNKISKTNSTDIQSKDSSQDSPTTNQQLQQLMAFHYHGYAFETPPYAMKFASTRCTPNQGFIFKNKVIGLQFHPETTTEWIQYLVNDKKSPLPTGPFCQSEASILEGQSHLPRLQQWYFQLLENLFNKN